MKFFFRPIAILLSAGLAAAAFSGCASSENRRTTGQYIDDQTLNARVKTALLREDEVAGFDVSTTTFDGVVQLSGFVENEEQRQRAEEIATEVPGVQTVLNNITVNPRAQQQYGSEREGPDEEQFEVEEQSEMEDPNVEWREQRQPNEIQ